MSTELFSKKVESIIDNLKAICTSYGLGSDGSEYKVVTQIFLYKFISDKFGFEIKKKNEKLKNSKNWEDYFSNLKEEQIEMLNLQLAPNIAKLNPNHLISYLFKNQNKDNFSKLFDNTLREISIKNNDIFSVKTDGGTKILLFENLSELITDTSKRDDFCRALINQLVDFNFEKLFDEKYDFFSNIFEYLIKDYNKDSGGKYAEYYTPHSVARIISKILIPNNKKGEIKNVSCHDPSAGSGTLLMSLAHQIGEDSCSIFSQDISQKSSNLLRLNLILNQLVHSINNVVQGNTISTPFHKDGNDIKKFDFIVSNPPFNMDFSDYRDDLISKTNKDRFFAGIPKIPKKKKDSMAIYQLFLQHILFCLNQNGKAAIVVPTGFNTAQSGIAKKIRKYIVENNFLSGVVTMPSNIFATTGTNVSIIFINKIKKNDVVLIDASKLGTSIKDGKNKKTLLSGSDEKKIFESFNNQKIVDNFSVVLKEKEIIERDYSFSAGQYFKTKIIYSDISKEEFKLKLENHKKKLSDFSKTSSEYDEIIKSNFKNLKYEKD